MSEDDLVVELPGEAALVPWRGVGKVVETDESLLFVGREDRPVYVPKRAFRDRRPVIRLRRPWRRAVRGARLMGCRAPS